ncbi:hypothetical protein M758_11G022600 [Ceratodon purpureus]|nr:hypothetical protein M758_11G022600 [Ceratodon purpureus]
MPWQSNIEIRGSCWLSCSGDPSRTMFSISGSIGKSRCGLLHPLPAELLVAGVGVPSSQCSVTNDDLDLLSSWLSNSFGDGESANSSASEGVRSVDRQQQLRVLSRLLLFCRVRIFLLQATSICRFLVRLVLLLLRSVLKHERFTRIWFLLQEGTGRNQYICVLVTKLRLHASFLPFENSRVHSDLR